MSAAAKATRGKARLYPGVLGWCFALLSVLAALCLLWFLSLSTLQTSRAISFNAALNLLLAPDSAIQGTPRDLSLLSRIVRSVTFGALNASLREEELKESAIVSLRANFLSLRTGIFDGFLPVIEFALVNVREAPGAQSSPKNDSDRLYRIRPLLQEASAVRARMASAAVEFVEANQAAQEFMGEFNTIARQTAESFHLPAPVAISHIEDAGFLSEGPLRGFPNTLMVESLPEMVAAETLDALRSASGGLRVRYPALLQRLESARVASTARRRELLQLVNRVSIYLADVVQPTLQPRRTLDFFRYFK